MYQTKRSQVMLQLAFAVLILFAGLMVALPAEARKTTLEKKQKGSTAAATTEENRQHHWRYKALSTMYIQGGVADIDLDALNGRLNRSGYDTIESPVVPIGFGFTHRFKRAVAGLDWVFLMHNTPTPPDDNLRMDVRNWYWQVTYGADVVRTDAFSLYALAGAGLGHTGIWIAEETGDSFNGVLREPARSTSMTQTSLVLSATVGADYRIETRKTDRKTSYFTIGLRGGYLFSPYAGAWHMYAADVRNGPERGFNGPSALLTIGWSTKRHPPKSR
ncbi:MAG: hypothetical protein JXX29_15905 [Deltaproteobacteria bacterium]|nr:hypothetical protein [Deltaproteobacteria bacterium]MBN2673166.1 hypothetical protein [Deltaproteobacteria bacterium]